MTKELDSAIVIRDADGSYYRFTAAMLEPARLPRDEAEALLQRLGDDVSGYLTPIPIPGALNAGRPSAGLGTTPAAFSISAVVQPVAGIRISAGAGR